MTAHAARVEWRHVATILCVLHLACVSSSSRDTLLGHIRLSVSTPNGQHSDNYDTSSPVIKVDHVRQCVQEVRGVIDRWIHEQGLSPLKDQRTNTSFLFQVRAPRLPEHGFFQITYDVYRDGTWADVSFWFVDLAGRVHDPAEFVELGTTAVLTALIEAARC
jgi:hypothetical protein